MEPEVAVDAPWPPIRLGSILTRIVDTGQEDLPLLSVSASRGVTLRGSDWGDGLRAASSDLTGYLVALPGDIVVNKLVARDGAFGCAPCLGLVSPAYYVLRASTEVDARFLDYLLHASPYLAEIGRRSKDMPPAQFDISWAMLRSMKVRLPNYPQQARIADFLDRETQRIDQLLQKHGRLVALAQERLGAQVDRELDGIHGPLSVLKRFVAGIEQGASPVCDNRTRASHDDWAVLKLSAVTGGTFRPEEHKTMSAEPGASERRYEVRDGDVLVTRANTPALVGDACYVAAPPPRLLLPDLIYRLDYDRSRVYGPWLARALRATRVRHQISSRARGSSQSMIKLRGEDIRALRVPIPPYEQQASMEARLAKAAEGTERFASLLRAQSLLLQERRQALITAAVTGQLELGEAA